MFDPARYEVSTEKDGWLSDYLQKLSIAQFNAFVEFADYVLNFQEGYRKDVLFQANRITRSFSYSFFPENGKIDYWFWVDKFKLFFFLEQDEEKRRAMDRLWRKESQERAKKTRVEEEAFWYRAYYSECRRFVENWTNNAHFKRLHLKRRRKMQT